MLALIPHIATQLYMAFGSFRLHDSCFNIAHGLKAVSYLVPLLGLLLEYMHTYRERRRAEQLAVLGAGIGTALTTNNTLRETLQDCTEIIVRSLSTPSLDAACARIWTLDEKENVLVLQASAGLYTHLDGPDGRVRVGEHEIGSIAKERRAYCTNSIVDDPRISSPQWAGQEGMAAFAGHPLIVDDQIVGVMAMFSRTLLTQDTLKTLGSVADQVALAIDRKQA